MRLKSGRVCRVQAVIDGTKVEVYPIKASESEKLTAWTGYQSLREWEARYWDGDPLACRAALALLRFRTGDHVRIAEVEIDDVDSIDTRLIDDQGREVTIKIDDAGDPVVRGGEPVFLFDGESDDLVPTGAASPSD